MKSPTDHRPHLKSQREVIRRDQAVVSKYMAAIRSRDTQPEQLLRRLLRRLGLRFQANYRRAPGTPDVAFVRAQVAVFVDGCFWHACSRCYVQPTVNTSYWAMKAQRNQRRDRRTNRRLRAQGWSVVRIRECALKRNPETCVRRIVRVLDRRKAQASEEVAKGWPTK